MAKKKTAKKELPVTADVELVEEYDATRYTPWIPDNMPVGGKSNSTEQLDDHPTEHNHSAEAISDIVDRFADLRLYVPAANSCGVDGNLRVDGTLNATGGGHYLSGGDQVLRIGNGTDANRPYVSWLYQGVRAGYIGYPDSATFRIIADGGRSVLLEGASVWVKPDLQVDGQTKAQNGTRSAPAYTFTADPDTGMHRPFANVIELVANGKRLMQLGTDAGSNESGAWMPPINTRTIARAGNVVIDTNVAEEGALYRSTASRAFMQEIESVNLDATNSVYDLSPIWFRSKCDGDNLEHSHYGLAAEDCAAVDPRLAITATDENGVETADNVNTNAVVALLVSAVQEQRATISDLTARIEALEATV